MTLLRQAVTTYLNVEMAATEEMVKIAIETRPDAVSLVPENPNEITTEGGLNVRPNIAIVRAAVNRLREAGIMTSLFIDPDAHQIEAARFLAVVRKDACCGNCSGPASTPGSARSRPWRLGAPPRASGGSPRAKSRRPRNEPKGDTDREGAADRLQELRRGPRGREGGP